MNSSDPETPVEEKVDQPIALVRGWFAALSFAGALAMAGFIARFSREQFLGISLGDWSVESLSLLAGRCGIDSMLLPLNFLLHHLGWLTLCAAVPPVCTIVVARWNRRPSVVAALRACGAAFFFCVLCVVLLRYEIPTIQLHDWITRGPRKPPEIFKSPTFALASGANSYINERYSDLVNLLIASKLDPDMAKTVNGLPSQETANDSIQAQYSISILACFGGWVYLSMVTSPRKSALFGRLLYGGELAVLGLLLVATILIPYMYGKLISSTEFPLVDIAYKEVSPPTALDKNEFRSDEALLIASSDKEVSILSMNYAVGKIVQIPRDRLLYLHFYGTGDALQDLFKQLKQSPAPAAPPP